MQQNNLNLGSIGQKLESARQRKGLTVSEIGRETKILPKFIHAMESDNFEVLSAPVYAKSFIRMYAQYLGLDPQPLIDDYLSIHAPDQKRHHEDSKRSTTAPPSSDPSHSTSNESKATHFNSPNSFAPSQSAPLNQNKTLLIAAGSALFIFLLIFTIKQCSHEEDTQPAPAPTATQLKRTGLLKSVPDSYLTDSGDIDIDLNKK